MRIIVLLVAFFLSHPMSLFAALAEVPQTGQTISYRAGDDGDLQTGVELPSPRFNNNGDGTITDNLTGLVWLTDANCFGYNDWSAALASANGLGSGSCGLSDGSVNGDWRLPNITELGSLMDAGQSTPELPVGYPFTGVFSFMPYYWSSTTDATNTANALIREMNGTSNGYVASMGKTTTGNVYLWPVREGLSISTIGLPKTGQTTSYATGDDGDLQKGVAWPTPRFTDNSDGTVTDNLTGLVWLTDANCFGSQIWNTALDSVNGLATGSCGLSDGSVAGGWRLPNRLELDSLIDRSHADPALPVGHLFTSVQPVYYWSSTTAAGSTGGAWSVNMLSGRFSNSLKSNSGVYLLPVRNAPSILTFDVTPSAGANGSMTPATVQAVDEGQTTSFEITSDAGFAIDSVSGCGGSLVGSTYTTGIISAACEVTASFVADADGDGIPDSIDTDDDNDGISDVDETANGTNPRKADTDGDSVGDGSDNCPVIFNENQSDINFNGFGDVCDTSDTDGDGVEDRMDAYPADPLNQTDPLLVTGENFNLATLECESSWGWGANYNGQMGNGTIGDIFDPLTNQLWPNPLVEGTCWSHLAAGDDHSLGVKCDGTLWTWGLNDFSQLGDGTTNTSSVPIQVGIENNWKRAGGSENISMAIKQNGTLWAWGGRPFSAPLGNGTGDPSSTPIQIGDDNDWMQIKIGWYGTLALQRDGSLWAWGGGSIGDGTTDVSLIPKLISSGPWIDIDANTIYSGVKADGTLWFWGDSILAPTQYGVDTDWQHVATGQDDWVVAIKQNGTLWYDDVAELYAGAGVFDDLPNDITLTQMGTDTDWILAEPSEAHIVAMKSDSSVWTFGLNYSGQLGNGTIDVTYTPTGTPEMVLSCDIEPPSPPTQIEAIDLGVGEVLVTWSNPAVVDFDHVIIYRSTVQGELGVELVDGLTGSSYIDGTVNERVTYYYTVRSVDTDGNESTNTTQVSVLTSDLPPGPPTGISAVDLTTGKATNLDWSNPPDSDFNCVNIYRSETSGVLGPLVGNCVPGTSVQDTGLANGVPYYYTIRAVDNGGNESTNTAQVTATPTNSGDVTGAGEVSLSTFDDPSNGESLTLGWTNPVFADLAYVLIYRSTDGSLGELVDGVDMQGKEGQTSTSWWTDNDVQGCVTYYYTMTTLDDAGNESIGLQDFHEVADTQAPLPVTALTATPVAGAKVQLDWNPSGSADATCYNVYGDNNTGTMDYGTVLDGSCLTANTYTTAALTNGLDYQFIVRTVGDCNQEETNTNLVSVTALTDPSAGNSCSAWIKVPQVGHKVGGNRLTVVADAACNGTGSIATILFEFSDDVGASWNDLGPLNNGGTFPNPDSTAPYFVHWDTKGVTDGTYLLRAVANGVTTPEPGTVLITVDNTNPPQASEDNTLNQKTEDVYQNAPSSSAMGDEDGITGIEIPADALGGDTEVVLQDVDTPPVTPPADYDDVGVYKDIHFGNGQGQLNNDKKAKVYLSYTDDDNDGFVDGSNPPISVYDLQVCNDHDNTWTCLNSTVDKANKQVKGLVDKFSTFGLMVPPKLVGSDLTMVAVPVYPSSNSTAAVLGPVNQYGSYVPVWDPTTGDWIFPSTVEPGRGYFVWGNGETLNVSGAEVPQVNFDISINSGWNMIGNPFRYQVALDQLQVNCGGPTVDLQTAEDNSWLIGTLFHYVNGAWQTWSVQDGDVLPTWKGLYILSDQTCTLTVPPIPAE